MGHNEGLQNFEGTEKVELNIKVIENGRIVTVGGYARGHKIYLKRIHSEKEGTDEYMAEIDGYPQIEGKTARILFDKYFSLAKFKAKL